jgi:hypothetical protein
MRGWRAAPRRIAAVALITIAAAGCNNFLDSAAKNPNAPTTASAQQLFTGIEVGQYTLIEGIIMHAFLGWTQQLYGSAMFENAYFTYTITQSTFDGTWASYYGGGGLHDLRTLEAIDRAAGDKVFLGIAQIWEAMVMGTVADIWGDAPYNDVLLGKPKPAFDNQLKIYAHVQALLDTAIANLTTGTGPGPGTVDFAFAGAPAPWIAVAHTLKARYYMHVAEVDATGYTSALAQVPLGISTPIAPFKYSAGATGTDLVAIHSSASQQQNGWWQFAHLSGFGPYLDSDTLAQFLVFAPNGTAGMVSATDPRAPVYFPASAGGPGGGVTSFNDDPTYPQPIVTYAENELIWSEAAFATGDAATAAVHLNNELTAAGIAATYTAGTVSLDSIMTEKFRAMYLQFEAWNDWKRTCIPAIFPVNATYSGAGGAYVPRRDFYSVTEGTTNTANYKAVAKFDQTATFRNRNDPGDPPGCPTTVHP